MNARYLIWSNQHARWWGPGHNGYTSIVEEAGRYELDQAREIVASATLDGQLRITRRSNLHGGELSTLDEVLVLAPESLQQLLDTVGHALHVSLCTCGVITGGFRDHREGCPMHGAPART